MGSQVTGNSVQPPIAPTPVKPVARESVPVAENQPKPQLQPTFTKLRNQEQTGKTLSIGEEQVYRAIEKAVKAMQGPETSVEMRVHEKTHAVMIKVVNKETGELIREIPPEKTLDVVAKMMEIAGIIIDEKV
ncbi:flagellar protein FlaG [Cohnella thailandensis]|uniref:Flagellar protein FlaG n=2 Tax=Cohnella thailandensis TaxID=557557 RepID=A0A841SR15_9BACL|nr:flagellar protein FlaG [Cohnella thailandensis]